MNQFSWLIQYWMEVMLALMLIGVAGIIGLLCWGIESMAKDMEGY